MNAVIVGSTGLIGGYLLEELLADDRLEKLVALTRKRLPQNDSKLVNPVVDFNNRSALENAFDKADVIFSAVGTTMKKVKGDEVAYRKVDFDIPVNLAQIGLQKGATQYILVSSLGADPSSGNFYLRLKGEVEQAITSLGYRSVYILRPSLLLGPRNEFRFGELVASVIMRLISIFFFGSLRKYHPIHAKDMAHAMVKASKENKPGVHVWYYEQL